MYSIDVRRRAQRALDRLPANDNNSVLNVLRELANDPRPRGVEKVKGKSGWWRVRQGDYRIVYDIDDDQKVITVVRIGHRREVYRGL